MVAYSFAPQFRSPIIAGIKRQTLRNERKRHARPGEQISLYTGMRTKHCAIIGVARCEEVYSIRIDFDEPSILEAGAWSLTGPSDLDRFAVNDGFDDFAAMRAFWAAKHPGVRQWEGVRILWNSFELRQ